MSSRPNGFLLAIAAGLLIAACGTVGDPPDRLARTDSALEVEPTPDTTPTAPDEQDATAQVPKIRVFLTEDIPDISYLTDANIVETGQSVCDAAVRFATFTDWVDNTTVDISDSEPLTYENNAIFVGVLGSTFCPEEYERLEAADQPEQVTTTTTLRKRPKPAPKPAQRSRTTTTEPQVTKHDLLRIALAGAGVNDAFSTTDADLDRTGREVCGNARQAESADHLVAAMAISGVGGQYANFFGIMMGAYCPDQAKRLGFS